MEFVENTFRRHVRTRVLARRVEIHLLHGQQAQRRLQCRGQHGLREPQPSCRGQECQNVKRLIRLAVLHDGALRLARLHMVQSGLAEDDAASRSGDASELMSGRRQVRDMVQDIHGQHAIERGICKRKRFGHRTGHGHFSLDPAAIEQRSGAIVRERSEVRVDRHYAVPEPGQHLGRESRARPEIENAVTGAAIEQQQHCREVEEPSQPLIVCRDTNGKLSGRKRVCCRGHHGTGIVSLATRDINQPCAENAVLGTRRTDTPSHGGNDQATRDWPWAV